MPDGAGERRGRSGPAEPPPARHEAHDERARARPHDADDAARAERPRPSRRPPRPASAAPRRASRRDEGGGAPGRWASYRLDVEFDGTRYSGWQEQQNARAVAGELRRAIGEVVGPDEIVELGGAGRTDAGVHALAQTAHLRLRTPHPPADLLDAINEALPSDIHVLRLQPAEPRFHARHQAESRSYVYQISRRRTAFGKRWVWWVRRPLDVARMREAAALLVGRHDFAMFCEQPAAQTSTLVEVESVEVATAGDLVLVRLVASHFLWKMVRRVVGTLVQVGWSEIGPAEVARLLSPAPLAAGSGSPAEWTAPPSGLFLERVRYAGDPPLAPIAPAIAVS